MWGHKSFLSKLGNDMGKINGTRKLPQALGFRVYGRFRVDRVLDFGLRVQRLCRLGG